MAFAAPHQLPWYRLLTRYHWFVFIVAALGWLFDTMDQQLFVLARDEAMANLLHLNPLVPEEAGQIAQYGGYTTAIFLMGWAAGGLGFGVMGDRVGRVRTMLLTILVYSIFTGLSVFSTGFWDFAAFRFLTGLGVGGEFAVGVSLVAEVMPDRARPHVLGLLQALSAVGNCTAALVYIGLGQLERNGMLSDLTLFGWQVTGWRIAFSIGTLPALLAIFVRRRLKEPERWKATESAGVKKRGSYAELFGDPRWRKHALVGLALGFAAVIGLWGIGFFSVQLQKVVFRRSFGVEGLSGIELEGQLKLWAGITSFMLNVGGFLGIVFIGWFTQRTNCRLAFALSFVIGMLSTAFLFWNFESRGDVFWMVPLMGFCQLTVFGCLAIYFPELFPTRLRSTGTSFCYNVGRFVAAVGPFIFGVLTSQVFTAEHGFTREPMRYAGVTMCVIFLLGLAVLPFAPETRGKPLPE